MRILLMGSPNVGKSALFSRLTGTHVIASNYSGTTVEFTSGKLKLSQRTAELIDVPGAYSLDPTNKAEEVAVKMIDEGDLIINVIDATNLERNLYLTLQLLRTEKPMIIALNMWDEANEHGMEINTDELERQLGVPVVPTCARSGEGIKSLIDRLPEAASGSLRVEVDEIWRYIGRITGQVQKIRHRHPSFGQYLSHATVHPVIGPFIALLVLGLGFVFVAYFGDWLHDDVMEELHYRPITS